MNDQTTQADRQRSPITLFAGGCLAILYVALCVLAAIFGRSQLTSRNSPTPTVTLTPVPHILVHAPSEKVNVVHEDFSSNKHDWGLYFHYGKLEVINGKLVLQSNVPNGIALGTSEHVSPVTKNYYIQGDFSTDIETASSYGLVFGLNRSLSTYYLFAIWPNSASFRLLKYNSGKWIDLIPNTPTEISSYPQANTLSVYFDTGNIELYINGELASKYFDKDYFQSKDMGIWVSDAGYRLIVDDLFVYDEK